MFLSHHQAVVVRVETLTSTLSRATDDVSHMLKEVLRVELEVKAKERRILDASEASAIAQVRK
jgi:hypothetical protein